MSSGFEERQKLAASSLDAVLKQLQTLREQYGIRDISLLEMNIAQEEIKIMQRTLSNLSYNQNNLCLLHRSGTEIFIKRLDNNSFNLYILIEEKANQKIALVAAANLSVSGIQILSASKKRKQDIRDIRNIQALPSLAVEGLYPFQTESYVLQQTYRIHQSLRNLVQEAAKEAKKNF